MAEYNEWSALYKKANLSMVDREDLVEVEADKLERGFKLIGSTAIEDKLQDEVGKLSH
jgi:magnesium-transporting ATPase (P-type)